MGIQVQPNCCKKHPLYYPYPAKLSDLTGSLSDLAYDHIDRVIVPSTSSTQTLSDFCYEADTDLHGGYIYYVQFRTQVYRETLDGKERTLIYTDPNPVVHTVPPFAYNELNTRGLFGLRVYPEINKMLFCSYCQLAQASPPQNAVGDLTIVNLDGTNPIVIASGTNGIDLPYRGQINIKTGKVVWVEMLDHDLIHPGTSADFTLKQCNLDGSGVTTLGPLPFNDPIYVQSRAYWAGGVDYIKQQYWWVVQNYPGAPTGNAIFIYTCDWSGNNFVPRLTLAQDGTAVDFLSNSPQVNYLDNRFYYGRFQGSPDPTGTPALRNAIWSMTLDGLDQKVEFLWDKIIIPSGAGFGIPALPAPGSIPGLIRMGEGWNAQPVV